MLNPVFRREVKTTLRSWKIFVVMAIYSSVLLFLGGITLFIMTRDYSFSPQSTVGLFIAMAVFQNLLVGIITPALTCGAIAGEREKQTLDIMLLTKMTPLSMIVGKLSSSILTILLLIIASLPIFSLILFFGSITLVQIGIMTLFTLLLATTIGSLSIFFSSFTKRTLPALIWVYLLLLVSTVGNVIFAFILAAIVGFRIDINFGILLFKILFSTNPVVGFISILDALFGFQAIESIFDSISYQFSQNPAFSSLSFNPVYQFFLHLPLWIYNVAFMVILTLFCLLLAGKFVKSSKTKTRKMKR